MLYAGISWTAAGFEIAVLDGNGHGDRPPVRFAADRTKEIASYLKGLGGPVTTVVDSTNGMLDGGFMAAGLDMYRADPAILPPRPAFGSVSAVELARAAWRDPASVVRLKIDPGSLTGRMDEHFAAMASSDEALATMTAAGRSLEHGDRTRGQIALTFDDGPNPPYTGRILDILESYGVCATFFCVGLNAGARGEDLRRMAEQGHGIGNHTWSHPYLPDLSPTELADQLNRTGDVVAAAVGTAPAFFRPPYGSRTPEVLRSLTNLGTRLALWDVDTEDWAMRGPDVIARTVLRRTKPGSIVLMHDGGGDRSQTVTALPSVIEGLLARGLEFVRVEDLVTPNFATGKR
ncbi:polysaccharide deacetylase family protein [Amycolatopsis regifaucium]|uniref:Polysaccharide deacetylase n=1 Tax=Amycolatopsis regifaucium TaxID=546365 RepID=A0A154M419_9PSEU|nr:polysaccharide deacetylase family protein [Amycolatopsis regifaucium]KZB79253.1 polysaccharide deacetylase [Amycolatopsis regifaucium]OKA07436.1 polysaccharide deacetylase [Amycolatopsis regifaucium]SFH11505.1 Peptidoglycan/xylan/chitin deacetylase, PgdA/CDA1 family [Amycolatopsis regifaucium]